MGIECMHKNITVRLYTIINNVFCNGSREGVVNTIERLADNVIEKLLPLTRNLIKINLTDKNTKAQVGSPEHFTEYGSKHTMS
jgi:hypothetical protein